MFGWADVVAFTVLLGALTFGYRIKLAAQGEKERNSTHYLLAESNADADRSHHLELGRQYAHLMESMAEGHDPECRYCECEQSQLVKGSVDRQSAVERRHKKHERQMQEQGWTPPGEA